MNKEKNYFENLDGLRFLAFLSVFIAHCFLFIPFKISSHTGNRLVSHLFLNGDLGVNFFFVLSGFLITFLLLKEKRNNTTISIRKFYMRRILRIWPVYFLVVCIGFFIIPALFNNVLAENLPFSTSASISKLPWYFFFVVNFDTVLNGITCLSIASLWSVSIEEQFYLIWPIINKVCSKYGLLVILSLIFILSYMYRLINYSDSIKMRYSTFSVINDLAIGGTAAWLSFYSQRFAYFLKNIKKTTIVSMYTVFLLCIPLRGFNHFFSEEIDRFLISSEPFIFSLFFAFIILEQNFSENSFYKISSIKLFNKLGIISYGLYCYHMMCILLVAYLFKIWFGQSVHTSPLLFLLETIITLLLTVFLSQLSYNYYESRFLRLKKTYNP